MRILLVSINFSPELTGVGKYSGEMAAWLGARGHQVRVVTAPPHYPQGSFPGGRLTLRYRREVLGSVYLLRCPLWVPAGAGVGARLVLAGSFAVASLPAVLLQRNWRPDLVFVVAPSLLCAPVGLLLSRLSGARSWLHLQDFEVDAAFSLFGERVTPAWAGRLEKLLITRFDRVSTISRKMCARLLQKGAAAERIGLVPNWVDLQAIAPDRGLGQSFRAEAGIPLNATVVLYSGSMGAKQGLEMVPGLVQTLGDEEDLHFVFCGEGSTRAWLESALAGRPRVRFLPLQPPARLNALLNCADIHLLPQRAGAADLVMPSKLGGQLASGGAVVAGALPGTEVFDVVRAGGGWAVEPGSVQEFARALRALARDAGLRAGAGVAARAYAERHLGQASILEGFHATVQSLCVGTAARRSSVGTVSPRR